MPLMSLLWDLWGTRRRWLLLEGMTEEVAESPWKGMAVGGGFWLHGTKASYLESKLLVLSEGRMEN